MVKRIPTYPYTLHLPITGNLQSNAPLPASDLRRYRAFLRSELQEFRRALDLAVALAKMSSQVATFALGGLGPLHYILERLGAFSTHVEDLPYFQSKFHVFGGLNWNGHQDKNKQLFLEWLAGLSPGTQLLLIDTGRDGSAAGTLFNFIKENSATIPGPITIQILVIGQIDRARPNSDHGVHEFGPEGGRVTVTKDVIRISDTATEDAIYLAGYMKSCDALGLDPINVIGGFKIILEDGQTAEVGSGTTAQAFINILAYKLELISVIPERADLVE